MPFKRKCLVLFALALALALPACMGEPFTTGGQDEAALSAQPRASDASSPTAPFSADGGMSDGLVPPWDAGADAASSPVTFAPLPDAASEVDASGGALDARTDASTLTCPPGGIPYYTPGCGP